jgi:hydrogenase nickel incorporation protein HypA/HybF
MHEVGLMEGIVDAVRRRAAGRPVEQVRVRIGVLHRAHPGPMALAWEMVGAGTVVDGARLALVDVPVTTTCPACRAVTQGPDRVPYCAACGATGVEHAGGDELTLESIAYRSGPGEVIHASDAPIALTAPDDDDDDDPFGDRRAAGTVRTA